MAAPWDVLVEADVEEPRILKGIVTAAADGTLWDKSKGADWYLCPVTKTAMLAPLPTTADWRTTFSSAYARIQKSGYTLTTAANWTELERTAADDFYLVGSDGTSPTTTTTYSANQPMYISFLVPGTETIAEQTVLTCGWGTQGASGSVWLRFRASGQVAVYKGADLVGVYDLEDGLSGSGGTKRTPGSINQQTVNVMLIPCRRRSLVVIRGDSGFEHVFSDLDPESTSNTITPAATFFWNVPVGQACVQLAPLKFKTSATLYSVAQKLRYPPETGATFNALTSSDEFGPSASSSTAVASLVEEDTTSYTPDDTIDTVRIKVVFSGNNTGSIGVYGVDAVKDATATTTADGTVDITCNLRSLRFEVPEVGATTGKIEMLDPPGLETLGMSQPAVTGDRPIRIAVAGIDIFRGTMKSPKLIESQGADTDDTDSLEWDIVDRTQDMIDATMQASYPLDGLYLTKSGATKGAVVQLLERFMGYTSADYNVSSDTFVLPYTPGVSAGEWSLLPQRGDTVQGWIERLYSDYAATFYTGWAPTTGGYKFHFVSPADMSDTPVVTLYNGAADAIAASVSASLVEFRTVKNFEVERIRPEANQIIVIGNDLSTGREIISQYDDAASQDPETLPDDRPENWVGKVVTFTYTDPAITTQDAADRAAGQLADRLAVTRVIARWDSELLIEATGDRTLWRGDVVRIYDEGGLTYDDWRIRSFSAELEKYNSVTGEALWNASYVAERLPAE